MALAVWRLGMPTGTEKFRPVIGLYQISWLPLPCPDQCVSPPREARGRGAHGALLQRRELVSIHTAALVVIDRARACRGSRRAVPDNRAFFASIPYALPSARPMA